MIDVNRWKTIEKVFNKSVKLPPGKQRDYVLSACRDDEELQQEVLSLLYAAESNKSFLSEPVFEVGAEILASEMIGLFDEPVVAAYELKKILGRGGTGVVFLAEDTISKREVALKILPESLTENDKERITRFQQEAKAVSLIVHPNVAKIFGFGKANNRYYLAMEYVSGKTLRDLINKNDLNLVAKLKIAIQIANALEAAHSSGILHRDIKPENIIVKDDGMVKVLDFGLAKPIPTKNKNVKQWDSVFDTKPGMIIGTPAYMSPEQIRGQQLDCTTDIWSFGVVLYEMLTKNRPFVGETPSDVQAKVLLSEPDYSEEVKKMPELKQIVWRSLQKNRFLRYQDAAEIIRDLEFAANNINVGFSKNRKYSDKFRKENFFSAINKIKGLKNGKSEDEITKTDT